MSDEPIEKTLFEAPPLAEQERMIEAILFASAEPVTLARTRQPACRMAPTRPRRWRTCASATRAGGSIS